MVPQQYSALWVREWYSLKQNMPGKTSLQCFANILKRRRMHLIQWVFHGTSFSQPLLSSNILPDHVNCWSIFVLYLVIVYSMSDVMDTRLIMSVTELLVFVSRLRMHRPSSLLSSNIVSSSVPSLTISSSACLWSWLDVVRVLIEDPAAVFLYTSLLHN